MITCSGSQESIFSKETLASSLFPKKVALRSRGVLPSGCAAPARRTSHP
jgi:hypothetical protein